MVVTTVKSGPISPMARALRKRESFRTHGALSGRRVRPGLRSDRSETGILPADWRNTFLARFNVIDYVVKSYDTPIAWHDLETGWTIPDERYSVTTTVHQGRVRYALTYEGLDYTE